MKEGTIELNFEEKVRKVNGFRGKEREMQMGEGWDGPKQVLEEAQIIKGLYAKAKDLNDILMVNQ